MKTKSMILGLSALFLSWGSAVQAAVAPPEHFKNGVVAADHHLASLAGMEVLKAGGNAFDAAVATSLALSVVRPQSTGIGGGGFMVYHTQGKAGVLDYREVAPAKASRDMYMRNGQAIPGASTVGYQATAVPGMLSGLKTMHERFGTQPFAELMQAAIRYAEQGFPADHHFIEASEVVKKRGARQDLQALFFPGGKVKKLGEIQRNPDLAKTLKTIAKQGVDSFYTGEISRKIVTAMRNNQGLISAKDLKNYRPKVRQPLRGTYRGHEIITMPPPSSGGAALLTVMNLLEPYNLGWNASGFGSSSHVQLLTESMKHAFSDRANYLGDPDFVDVPLDTLASKAYANKLQPALQRAMLNTLSQPEYGLKGLSHSSVQMAPVQDHGTTHYAIMDRFGNVVSATETINTYFGSQVVIPGTGIIMNNEMDDFSKSPGVPNAFGLIGNEANAIAPGKKPLSSMTPTIVMKDGKPFLAAGASGGPRIITGTLQTLLNVIDFGMDVNAAVSAPRFHHQWVPNTLFIEREMPLDVRQQLRMKGHHLVITPAENVAQAVMFKDGWFTGASDPRKGGRPAGY